MAQLFYMKAKVHVQILHIIAARYTVQYFL